MPSILLYIFLISDALAFRGFFEVLGATLPITKSYRRRYSDYNSASRTERIRNMMPVAPTTPEPFCNPDMFACPNSYDVISTGRNLMSQGVIRNEVTSRALGNAMKKVASDSKESKEAAGNKATQTAVPSVNKAIKSDAKNRIRSKREETYLLFSAPDSY
ncbi:hypothetical protein ENBRE01_0344 [Enteropsectra breve]|nr:hypothetical protein ENBRE01_0344 [Enteropsectra breve]